MLKTQKTVMMSLIAAAILSAGTLAATPSAACGGYQQPVVTESTRAQWAVKNHFASHRKIIKRVAVALTGANKGRAVMHFKKDSKLPPLLVDVQKIDGRWHVAATRTWRG